ncbi:unnamed protein product [Calypogeia fissa]
MFCSTVWPDVPTMYLACAKEHPEESQRSFCPMNAMDMTTGSCCTFTHNVQINSVAITDQEKGAQEIEPTQDTEEADAQPDDTAEGADSVVGVLATPIVKKTARNGRGAKTAVDGAQKTAKAKAAPRARKEKAPKVPKEKPAT